MAKEIDNLYKLFKDSNFVDQDNHDVRAIFNTLQSGKRIARIDKNYVEALIDIKWVEEIEKCIIPLDTIIRNPGRFIKKEDEIIPIEMARNIDNDSIRHLAQHTNLIQSVKKDQVTPRKILNGFKEESYDTYENRFIYTLLINLNYFIDKRLELILNTNGKNEFSIQYQNHVMIGEDDYQVKIEISTTNIRNSRIDDIDKLISVDVEKLNKVQRINRIRQIIYDFQASQFFKNMEGCNKVRSPLQMTNMLLKNVDYQACVTLWAFIQTYDEKGIQMNSVKLNSEATVQAKDDFDSISSELFVLLKKYTGNDVLGYEDKTYELVEQTQGKIVDKAISKLMNELNLSTEAIRKTFIDHLDLANKKSQRNQNTIKEIIARAIRIEKEKEAKYLANLKEERKKKLDLQERLAIFEKTRQERLALNRLKKDAILEINSYKNIDDYNTNNQELLKEYLKEGFKSIRESKAIVEINNAVSEFKKKADLLKVKPVLYGRRVSRTYGREVKVYNSKQKNRPNPNNNRVVRTNGKFVKQFKKGREVKVNSKNKRPQVSKPIIIQRVPPKFNPNFRNFRTKGNKGAREIRVNNSDKFKEKIN